MTRRTRINLQSHADEISNQTVMQIAQAIRNTWAQEAKARLKTTAKDYISAIRTNVRLGTSPSIELYLAGTWANKLEYGFPSYDMKPMLARSSKKKISEESGQWYLHVPFRHTTPASTGRTGANMSNAVYREARRLPMWGKLTSPTGSGNTWGKYEGMQKVPESPTSKRGAYITWRTVSENSPASAFIHPGFQGVHIIRDLSTQIQDTFSKLYQANMRYSLGDNKG